MEELSFRSILFIIVVVVAIFITEAKIGYDMNVVVSNSTMQSNWRRSQSTEVLALQIDGEFSGEGNFTKYLVIDGFAGIGMKENTFAKDGRIRSEDRINLNSEEEYIYINQIWDNESERYFCEINESLPTLLYNENNIRFRGESIRSRSNYKNNEDCIYTKYYSNELIKSVRYFGLYSNALITAKVTPDSVEENVTRNSLLAFGLSSSSDRYSELGFVSGGEQLIEENYVGSFTISETITKQYEGLNLNMSEEMEISWLEACFSDCKRGSELWHPEDVFDY